MAAIAVIAKSTIDIWSAIFIVIIFSTKLERINWVKNDI